MSSISRWPRASRQASASLQRLVLADDDAVELREHRGQTLRRRERWPGSGSGRSWRAVVRSERNAHSGTLTCGPPAGHHRAGDGLHSARPAAPAARLRRSPPAPPVGPRRRPDVRSKPRAHRLHHPSVVPAARHGAVPSRVPGPAARDRRPADRRRARRLPASTTTAPAATHEQLARVHGADYIATIEAESPASGLHYIDPDTAMNPHSLTAARHAAGAVVLATDLVVRGECRTAFCAVRPPGHHAERDRAMGFCLFNNVAVGAAHALAAHGARARRDHRLRRASRQRHRGHLRRRPARADGLDVPASALSVFGRRQPGAEHGQRAARARAAAARRSATP